MKQKISSKTMNNGEAKFRSEKIVTGFNPISEEEFQEMIYFTVLYKETIVKSFQYRDVIKPHYMWTEDGIAVGSERNKKKNRIHNYRLYRRDKIVSYTIKEKS